MKTKKYYKNFCDELFQRYQELYFENKKLNDYILYLESKIDGRLEEYGNSLKEVDNGQN
ncbi:MAG: hypothetical protein J6C17_04420 [Clostridia bacterium]|nr:hypothetical protein [Clostridia bacterium]